MIFHKTVFRALVASSIAYLGVFGLSAAAQPVPDAEYRFGAYDEASGAFFAEAKKESIYVPMPDGTRLAADLYLPSPLAEDAQLPTLLHMTRYWREYQLSWPFEDDQRLNRRAEFFARRGYAVMLIDVRGTGASFGSRPGPHSPQEVQDGCDLARWVGRQPWANGKVGAFGDSYSGTSAALLATCNDANIKVVIPRFYEWDVYTDIAYPGGIFHQAFVKTWAAGNDALDANKTPKSLFGFSGAVAVKGVAPAGGKDGAALLEHAVAEHRGNVDVFELARRAEFRDRTEEGRGSSGFVSIDSFSLHNRQAALDTTPTVIYAWGSWLDAGTARSVLAQVMNLGADVHGIIGAWNHGADHHASPYLPPAVRPVPTVFGQRLEFLKVFDHYLKGQSTDLDQAPKLTYFTLGEERWKTTESWPPEGFERRRFFLGVDSQLSSEDVTSDSGIDVYDIDFSASTGVQNRWFTQHGDTDVFYGDRRIGGGAGGGHRLSYTSPPLAESIEITGHPVVELELSSSTTDNAVYVYIEDVAPDGSVRYVTDGQLRLAARRLDDSPPYTLPVPRPSFREADAEDLLPDEAERVSIPMLPTSAVLRAGHRLRLSIAGHDADSFERIPAAGPSTLTVHRNDSFLEVPMRPRPDLDGQPPLDLERYAGRYRFPEGGVIRVRSAPAFLHVGAEDPEAVELLEPCLDSAGPWQAQAHRLLEALQKKNKKTVRSLVSDGSFKELWKLRKTIAKGPVSFAGSTRWLGEPMTVFQVEAESDGGRGRRSLMLIWDREKLKVMRWGLSDSLPGYGRYLGRSLSRFEAMDPRPVTTLDFAVEDGRVEALILDGIRGERIEPVR